MARVKRGIISQKRRRNVLKQAKGYRFGRRSKERQAKEAVTHAGAYACKHRRMKKRTFRALWNIKIGASVRGQGMSYSQFISALKNKNILLNRKVLSEIGENEPETLNRIVEQVKE